MKITFTTLFLFLCSGWFNSVSCEIKYHEIFSDRDACFLLIDLKTAKQIEVHNNSRCELRFSPYSTFKIPAVAMAFELGIFKDENQVVKWDEVKRTRDAENKDQTPLTFMSQSVKWVTEWIIPKIKDENLRDFLETFNYGNKDFSGGPKDAWVSSSLQISAFEQIAFLSKLWTENLGLSDRTTALTKKSMLVNQFASNVTLYGKTGSGCLVGNECMTKPGQMLGWFVGVLETPQATYVIAGNAADHIPQAQPAGPRMRKATIEILKNLELINE